MTRAREAWGAWEARKRKCGAPIYRGGFSTAPWFWRRGLREFGLSCLRCGNNPYRWKSRRAGGRAQRYRLKVLANKRDVPYQSLLKVLLAERLKQEEATQGLTLRPLRACPERSE